jgi:hypothetical protein
MLDSFINFIPDYVELVYTDDLQYEFILKRKIKIFK